MSLIVLAYGHVNMHGPLVRNFDISGLDSNRNAFTTFTLGMLHKLMYKWLSVGMLCRKLKRMCQCGLTDALHQRSLAFWY